MSTAATIPILSSIAGIAAGRDAWIVDIWGVMHNGARTHRRAVDACRTFRAQGGTVVLISNAPRPFPAVVPHLNQLGVDRETYDTGVTSGDVTRGLIAPWKNRPVLHIGPERDQGLFEGQGVRLVGPDAAEMLVCSGLYDDSKETPADYAVLFESLLARRVPMICANPDIVVERGAELIYCAGALAADYTAKGGQVTYAGKPHPVIYERTLAEVERLRGRPVPKQRVLAIGDGIETDLRGAHAAGLDCVFIASTIHVPGNLDAKILTELFAERPFSPVAALSALTW